MPSIDNLGRRSMVIGGLARGADSPETGAGSCLATRALNSLAEAINPSVVMIGWCVAKTGGGASNGRGISVTTAGIGLAAIIGTVFGTSPL